MRKTCAKVVEGAYTACGREHDFYSPSHSPQNTTMDNSPTFHQNLHTVATTLSTVKSSRINLLIRNLSTQSTGLIINTKRETYILNTYY